MFGWLVENIWQWFSFPIGLASGGDNMYTNAIIAVCFVLFVHILVPYIQLLNEARIKTLILRSGWAAAIKLALKYKHTAVQPQPTDNDTLEMGSLNETVSYTHLTLPTNREV